MMGDMQRLCKRDHFFWLILAVIMLGLVAHMTLNVLGDYLNETTESVRRATAYYSTHSEGKELLGELNRVWIPFEVIRGMMMGILGVSFGGMAVRMLLQETKNREEVLNIFPVKSRSRLTYHYISGLFTVGVSVLIQTALIRLIMLYVEKREDIIFIGFEGADFFWSYAAKTVVIFMLHDSLLTLCRKLTNHIAGTIFTFFVVELAMWVFVGYCLGWYWNNLLVNSVWCWLFWTIMAVVFIILSYITDRKKDYARNGFYAFPAAHWMIMGVVFAEVCYVFYGTYENIPKLVSCIWTVAASLLITAGVHFLTRPKSI